MFLRSTPIDLEPRRDEATGEFFPWGLPEGDYSQKRLRRLQAQAFGGPFWDGHLMYGPQSSLGILRTPEQQFVDVLAARKREALRRTFPDATRLFRHRLQLQVVLNDISPPLYRRLTVAAGITLATLHSRVLAPALGWHRSQVRPRQMRSVRKLGHITCAWRCTLGQQCAFLDFSQHWAEKHSRWLG